MSRHCADLRVSVQAVVDRLRALMAAQRRAEGAAGRVPQDRPRHRPRSAGRQARRDRGCGCRDAVVLQESGDAFVHHEVDLEGGVGGSWGGSGSSSSGLCSDLGGEGLGGEGLGGGAGWSPKVEGLCGFGVQCSRPGQLQRLGLGCRYRDWDVALVVGESGQQWSRGDYVMLGPLSDHLGDHKVEPWEGGWTSDTSDRT